MILSGEEPTSNSVILLMMDVYRQALQFLMSRLEQLCLQYLEACIGHRNVLAALQNAAKIKLDYIKVRSQSDHVSRLLGQWVTVSLGYWVSGLLGQWVTGSVGYWVSGLLGQ